MQKIILITFTLGLLASCDAPTRNRYPTVPNFDSGSVNFDSNGYSAGGTGTNINTTNGSGTGSSGGSTTNQQGYENCSLAMTNYGNALGYFGICQHEQDDRGFKFKFANKETCQGGTAPTTNCGSCFIPMHLGANGSYALGPAQCVHNEKDVSYFGTFQKSINSPINSIMVIHRYAVDSFFQCMGAYDQKISQCYGGAQNYQCVQQAKAWADHVCQSFVNTHSNNYKQVSFN